MSYLIVWKKFLCSTFFGIIVYIPFSNKMCIINLLEENMQINEKI